MNLIEFVQQHTERGECQCGKCIDRGDKPDPTGHTVDTGFFKVALVGEPDKHEFKRLIKEHVGDFGPLNPWDGMPHVYTEVGAWIGDQGLAMQFMALGKLLDVWMFASKPGMGCIIIGAPSPR